MESREVKSGGIDCSRKMQAMYDLRLQGNHDIFECWEGDCIALLKCGSESTLSVFAMSTTLDFALQLMLKSIGGTIFR